MRVGWTQCALNGVHNSTFVNYLHFGPIVSAIRWSAIVQRNVIVLRNDFDVLCARRRLL